MKAVLFDLDGTLLDTRDMILESFKYAYTTVIGEDCLPTDAEILSLVGIPLITQMELINPDKSKELFEAYLANNATISDSMLRSFEGTEAALARLVEQGFRLAVVTSKRHGSALHGLECTGIDGYFEFLIGADDVAEHKPKPGPLLEAAKRMELPVSECTYMGDSPYDMAAARSAEMYAIGALWGIFSETELVEAGAELLLADISELPDTLRDFGAATPG